MNCVSEFIWTFVMLVLYAPSKIIPKTSISNEVRWWIKKIIDLVAQFINTNWFSLHVDLNIFQILHRDLATRNILLGEGRLCKISGFGFASSVIENHRYAKLTQVYCGIFYYGVINIFTKWHYKCQWFA